MLYNRHLQLYEQYVTALLLLYEQHCPGFSAILALVSMGQDLEDNRLLDFHSCLGISPIVHPQPWGPDDPKLIELFRPPRVLTPLLASILALRVP